MTSIVWYDVTIVATLTGQYGIMSQYAQLLKGHVTRNQPIGFEYLYLTYNKV